MRVQDELEGDLLRALRKSPTEARNLLKRFPNISDPGADRILLFAAAILPISAVPSNKVTVIIRLLYDREREDYRVNYRESQQTIEQEVAAMCKRGNELTCS